ncbi:MAG: hypothetical protein ACUVWO_11690 [Thermodesulfobacteriota bacterium]
MDRQIDFLKRLKNSRPQKEEELENYVSTLKEIRQKMGNVLEVFSFKSYEKELKN